MDKESLRLHYKLDSQNSGELQSKDYPVDEFSLGRNGQAPTIQSLAGACPGRARPWNE